MLSTKGLNLLADALAPNIAKQIMSSEAFVEVLMELIPGLVDAELGECDEDLHYELSMLVMERITLGADKPQG